LDYFREKDTSSISIPVESESDNPETDSSQVQNEHESLITDSSELSTTNNGQVGESLLQDLPIVNTEAQKTSTQGTGSVGSNSKKRSHLKNRSRSLSLRPVKKTHECPSEGS